MTVERFERYRTAYLEMARRARYRPQAPSDGLGNIDLEPDELADPARLEQEARDYGERFVRKDDAMEYGIGCPDFTYNRAFCYLIEAAQALCSPRPKLALDLLLMARGEIAVEMADDPRK